MQIELTPEYLASQGLSENFPQRFWAKVHKTETCWLWTACLNKDGYGIIGSEGGKSTRTIRAHQGSWILHNGPIPEGKIIRHQCRPTPNPACVNPSHLLLGCKADNTQDAIDFRRETGAAHWNAMLTNEQVIEIRRLSSTGITNVEIGKQFGISPHHVSKIKHWRCWLHMTGVGPDWTGWQI